MINKWPRKQWTAETFFKVYLWLHKAIGAQCRGCKKPVGPEDIVNFVTYGCPDCGGLKLDLCREKHT